MLEFLLVMLVYLPCQVAATLGLTDDCRVMARVGSDQTVELGGERICYHRDFELLFRDQVVLSTDPEPCR